MNRLLRWLSGRQNARAIFFDRVSAVNLRRGLLVFSSYFAAIVLSALAGDGIGVAPAYAQTDGTDGHPIAILKICKVAGPGVALGTPFNFTVNPSSGTVTVAAGQGPGGNCWIAGGFPVNSTVVVTEQIPSNDVVTSITSSSSALVVTPPATATVSNLVAGMTTVTYTNEQKRVGYLEICKYAKPAGINFIFTTNPSLGGPITVPSMGCSPPFQVPAGSVVVSESAPSPYYWAACAKYQGGLPIPPCNVVASSTTVTVVAGPVSSETLLLVLDLPHKPGAAAPQPDDNAMQQILKSLRMTPAQ